MSKMRHRYVLFLAACACALSGIGLGLVGASGHAEASPPPPLPEAAVSKLAARYQISVTPDTPGDAVPAISEQEALARAPEVFKRTSTAKRTAHLVRFTDGVYGRIAEVKAGGDPADSKITLHYVNRRAWVVLIPNSIIPLLGHHPGVPQSYVATLCVFIDANTGAFLESVTLPE